MTGEGRREEPVTWARVDGAPFWPAPEPLNVVPVPKGVPMRPQGRYAVIVRMRWPSGDELVPGTAIRWTGRSVMVTVKPPNGPSNATELVCWLSADDVYRTVPRRPRRNRPST